MWISGEHAGKSKVEFDWLEEGGCAALHKIANDGNTENNDLARVGRVTRKGEHGWHNT